MRTYDKKRRSVAAVPCNRCSDAIAKLEEASQKIQQLQNELQKELEPAIRRADEAEEHLCDAENATKQAHIDTARYRNLSRSVEADRNRMCALLLELAPAKDIPVQIDRLRSIRDTSAEWMRAYESSEFRIVRNLVVDDVRVKSVYQMNCGDIQAALCDVTHGSVLYPVISEHVRDLVVRVTINLQLAAPWVLERQGESVTHALWFYRSRNRVTQDSRAGLHEAVQATIALFKRFQTAPVQDSREILETQMSQAHATAFTDVLMHMQRVDSDELMSWLRGAVANDLLDSVTVENEILPNKVDQPLLLI